MCHLSDRTFKQRIKKGKIKQHCAQLNCSEMPFLYLLLSGNGPEHIMHEEGGRGFTHIAKLVHRPCCCWCALFDVCAQFNKAFIFKTRWWLALIFSNSVQGFSLGAAEWHSSYCFICASGFYFVPVQNNKNTQVCLFAGLVMAKMNRYRGQFYLCVTVKGLRWY